jgi:hypothetical protein
MGYATRVLTQLPFGHIIGSPMKAAIEAQALAARSTVEFIQAVGFENQDDELFSPSATGGATPVIASNAIGPVRTVTFKYKRQSVDGGPGGDIETELTVPLLTIVPIPFLRIDEMTIDFTAKITEEFKSTNKTSLELGYQASSSFKYKAFWSPVSVNFNASVSSKFNASRESSSRFSTEATMSIHVKAVQDEMPGGLSKILQILEASIKNPAPSGGS